MKAEIGTIPQLIAFRGHLRGALAKSSFSKLEREEILLALTELGTNLIRHGCGGSISVSMPTEDSPVIRITARNNILSACSRRQAPAECATGRSGGLGLGLGTLVRMMDRVEFDPGEGNLSVICEKAAGRRRAN